LVSFARRTEKRARTRRQKGAGGREGAFRRKFPGWRFLPFSQREMKKGLGLA